MKDQEKLKAELVEACQKLLQSKLELIDQELTSIQKAASEETKSSAGDKYETGRAMLMLEKEKLLNQKEQAFSQLKPLTTIDVSKKPKSVETGTIVTTTSGTYFIASSLGKVEIANEAYFVVSPLAPIAQQMLGKEQGATINFNGRQIKILALS